MKTTLKRVLSMALALVLLVGALPMSVLADATIPSMPTDYMHGVINSHNYARAHISQDRTVHGYYCSYGGNSYNATCSEGHVTIPVPHTDTTGDGYCDFSITYGNYTVTCGYQIDPCAGGHAVGTNGTPATCMDQAVCGTCGNSFGSLADHAVGTNGTPATCTSKAICGTCDQEFGNEPAGHAVGTSGTAATCTTKAVCGACNQEFGNEPAGHAVGENGRAATCTTKAVCGACSQEFGNEPAGHAVGTNGTAATCTSKAVCGTCNQPYGNEPAGHTPGAAATCTAPQVCTVCGDELATALPHNYTGLFKSCSMCGARESDSDVTVNFYVDGTFAETKTSATPATIQTLITNLCTVDDNAALIYDYAIANNANAALTTVVNAGQTANIYLKTKATTSYIVYYNVNVDASKDNRPIDSFVSGATMGDALDVLNGKTITRPGLYPTWFKLAGWYMDRACTTPVNRYAPITEDTVVYAKWERKYNYEVTLKLYTNGNTNTVVKVVDAFAYIQDDGILSNSEVTAIAKQYIQSNNDAPITAYGPFKSGTEWDNYCKYPNRLSTQNQYIAEDDPATVLHVMVHNAKIYNSTSSTGKKADSSNPKTGDMILMPAAIMGTSVTALAVMFYLKKKRTV